MLYTASVCVDLSRTTPHAYSRGRIYAFPGHDSPSSRLFVPLVVGKQLFTVGLANTCLVGVHKGPNLRYHLHGIADQPCQNGSTSDLTTSPAADGEPQHVSNARTHPIRSRVLN